MCPVNDGHEMWENTRVVPGQANREAPFFPLIVYDGKRKGSTMGGLDDAKGGRRRGSLQQMQPIGQGCTAESPVLDLSEREREASGSMQ